MDIGGKGLANANLTIPQKCSISFDIIHKDSSGEPVDHTGSSIHMAFQSRSATFDLSDCCSGTETGVIVNITADKTEAIPLGKMSWDIIAETVGGDTIRLVYGNVKIVDTYALDESNGD